MVWASRTAVRSELEIECRKLMIQADDDEQEQMLRDGDDNGR
jgi:hypothetical protein